MISIITGISFQLRGATRIISPRNRLSLCWPGPPTRFLFPKLIWYDMAPQRVFMCMTRNERSKLISRASSLTHLQGDFIELFLQQLDRIHLRLFFDLIQNTLLVYSSFPRWQGNQHPPPTHERTINNRRGRILLSWSFPGNLTFLIAGNSRSCRTFTHRYFRAIGARSHLGSPLRCWARLHN